MSKEKCWLCLRITPKQVARAVRALPFPKDKKHEIFQISIELIEKAYRKSPTFFCGKKAYRIIGGLLYLLSFKYCRNYSTNYPGGKPIPVGRIPQLTIAHKLNFLSPKNAFCSVTIRNGYRDWLKLFPELKEKFLWS